MDFHTFLSTGGDVKVVLSEFIAAFLKSATSNPDNWFRNVSHRFVDQCFRVLGLRFNVSVAAFSRRQDHPYRNDNAGYVFDTSPRLLGDVRTFFYHLPYRLSKIATALELDIENCRFDRLTHPVTVYLRVVDIWVKVVDPIRSNMELKGEDSPDHWICEPLARMSFYIVNGLSRLLPDWADFGGLKDICLSLALNVRFAIFYEASCDVIVTPMLDMFQEHYRTFCGAENSALDFVFCILIVVMDVPHQYIEAYEFLESMLNQFAESQERDESNTLYLRVFTNELITTKYMVKIFDTLMTSKSKPLLMATLKYLMTLQRHLVSTECFTLRFHEGLLQLILRSPAWPPVSGLAAEVYVKLSLRKYREREVVQHILETYGKDPRSQKIQSYPKFRSDLTRYLKVLGQHLPALNRFEFYAYILNAPIIIDLSLLTAQAVSILFERLMAEYEAVPEAREQVNQFLRYWPYLVRTASHQTATRPILWSVYGMINFAALAQRDKELLTGLERFCLENFLQDDTLRDSEFEGLYSIISSSVEATKNEAVLAAASRIVGEQQGRLMALLDAPGIGESERVELVDTYAMSVRRLHSLCLVNKLDVHHVNNMYKTLSILLFEEEHIRNDSLTRYGAETLATMLVVLNANPGERNISFLRVKLTFMAQLLMDFCMSELSDSNLDFKRAKFLFCSVLILHVNMVPGIELDGDTYDTLLEWLALPPRDVEHESESLVENYLIDMHSLFRMLIQRPELVLPNNRIWKVLVHYKMMGPAWKYLDLELEKLFGALIEHRIEGYVHCLPVILLQVNGEKIKNKARSALFTAHLSIIEQHASAFDAWMLRLILFQDLLYLLGKNMRARRSEVTSSRQRNRLLALRDVLPLLSDLRLQADHFNNVAKPMHSLKEEAIGSEETSVLETFITDISRFKYCCEDEHAEVVMDDNFPGELIPLPPGPMDHWQHEALRVPLLEDNDPIEI